MSLKKPFQLFNSFTHSKEVFIPSKDTVNIYSCGPTVYNEPHIGNMRSYLFADLLVRSLRLEGFKTRHVVNLTDIDDKIVKGLKEKNTDSTVDDIVFYTEPFIQNFFEAIQTLRITPADHYPKATEHMHTITNMIHTLKEKGYAYEKDQSIYYAINKFKNYGKLAKIDFANMKTGTRYNTDEYPKDDIRDFALWKYNDGNVDQIYWETEHGPGRPGWHIECSAMIHSLFSEPVDIHTGGVDLMFPHHENEIAQSEAAFDRSFVKLWMHCEHLIIDNKKMSKSLGNFYTLSNLLQKDYSALLLRYFLLTTHYRQKLYLSFDILEQANHTLHKIQNTYERFEKTAIQEQNDPNINVHGVTSQSNQLQIQFLDSLKNDLNISEAMANFHAFLKYVNHLLDQAQDVLPLPVYKILDSSFDYFNSILDILLRNQVDHIPQEVQILIQKRNQHRENKEYAKADHIRNIVYQSGYMILDTHKDSQIKKVIHCPDGKNNE